jgi:hypothetical protein
MNENRVFSEEEVAEIMRRAVTLQEQTKHGAAEYRPGVTQAELQRAAKEMGVDPAFLEQAIREKLEGVPTKQRGILPEEQRVVEGELDPEDFDIILSQVKNISGRRPITQVGRTLRGRAFTGSGLAELEVTSRNGRTKISVKPTFILEALGMFYPAFIVTLITNANLAGGGSPLTALAATTGAFGLAALGFRAWLSKSRAAATKLADKLQDSVTEHIASESPLRERLSSDSRPDVNTDEAQDENRTVS